jgi:hypothetical protein
VDAITARGDVVAAARDRARYHDHMEVVEAATTEEAAMRVQWDSFLFEALKRRRRQGEMSFR